MLKHLVTACALIATAAISPITAADDITRNKIPNSNFPIAESVQVPGAAEIVFVSGAVPQAIVEGGGRLGKSRAMIRRAGPPAGTRPH